MGDNFSSNDSKFRVVFTCQIVYYESEIDEWFFCLGRLKL